MPSVQVNLAQFRQLIRSVRLNSEGTMPGEKPFGCHEGSRSEYLAQYAFASWGTAVVIPQQEDHGLDLHCTLMEQVGRRFLAKCPYTVQVKSELKPVVFDGKDAVRWV